MENFLTDNPAVKITAQIVSILGHPLVVLGAATILFSFHFYGYEKAILISTLIFGIVILPITVHNFVKARSKVYTNFDVSDQKQRDSFYRVGLVLLGATSLTLYIIPGAREFFAGTLVALLMIFTAAFINSRIKASLHTAVIIYIALATFSINPSFTIVLLFFALLVAISRLILKRHSRNEVLVGAVIGIVFGLVLITYNSIF